MSVLARSAVVVGGSLFRPSFAAAASVSAFFWTTGLIETAARLEARLEQRHRRDLCAAQLDIVERVGRRHLVKHDRDVGVWPSTEAGISAVR